MILYENKRTTATCCRYKVNFYIRKEFRKRVKMSTCENAIKRHKVKDKKRRKLQK